MCKYDLDRSQWSTYSKFAQMYDQIEDELVDSGISTERELETRMDIGKNIVQEKNALCCKVTHNIDKPDWVLVMSGVGGNTNQKGDDNVGGE